MQHTFDLIGNRTPKFFRRVPGLKNLKPVPKEGFALGPYLKEVDKYVAVPQAPAPEPPRSLEDLKDLAPPSKSRLERLAERAADVTNRIDGEAKSTRKLDDTDEDKNHSDPGVVALGGGVGRGSFLAADGEFSANFVEESWSDYQSGGTLSRGPLLGDAVTYSEERSTTTRGSRTIPGRASVERVSITQFKRIEVAINQNNQTMTVLEG